MSDALVTHAIRARVNRRGRSVKLLSRRAGQGGPGGGDHSVDIVVGVGEADEHRLELRRRQEDPVRAHAAEKSREPVGVGGLRGRVVGDGAGREEQGQHRADPVDDRRDAGRERRGREPIAQAGAELLELLVRVRAREDLHRLQARRHRERIAAERAGLIDGPERRELVHDVGAAAERRGRQAAADDLADRREIGRDAVARLGAAERDPKAGHDLVEDQDGAVRRAQRAQALEVAGGGDHQAHVAGDRLDDDRGADVDGMGGERALDRAEDRCTAR